MSTQESPELPRVAITFCTQCKWLLRGAYYAQELLSTFSTSLGEVALIPATGGTFTVSITYDPDATQVSDSTTTTENQKNTVDGKPQSANVKTVLLWDRKAEGGFPETKVLKQRVRDCIEPGRNLGHSDVGGKKGGATDASGATTSATDGGVERSNDEKNRSEAQSCGPDGC